MPPDTYKPPKDSVPGSESSVAPAPANQEPAAINSGTATQVGSKVDTLSPSAVSQVEEPVVIPVRPTAECGPAVTPERPRPGLLDFLQNGRSWWLVAALLVLVVGSLALFRLLNTGKKSNSGLLAEESALVVPVAKVTREDLFTEVPIPAEFRAYQEVELHAKVSGYVKDINVDFGDRVKAGQLLATLEVPELQDELDRARATEKRAEADNTDAHLLYTRLRSVDKDHPNLVAQQDLDTAEAKDHTTEAAIAAAKADVEKYQTLVAYTHITAPFDGVITHRYADPGALIQAGTASETQSLPLVRVSDNYRLRLDFPVSVAYVKDIHVGDSVEVRVQSLGDRNFTGKITRTTMRVNEDTRTMTTEVEVPNPNLELVPGMYSSVIFKVQNHPQALAVPIQALPPGQTSTIYVLNEKRQIEERPITLGIQTPDKYEVIAGLKEGDMVLVGSRSRVKPGQTVEGKLVGPLALQ
jgi:RND family efflux transporter MFP subunit